MTVTEEILELDDIQGGIIPGFKKDYSLIIGLFIDDVPGCKAWLKKQANEVSRASDVSRFNQLHREMRARRGNDSGLPAVVWKSISFSGRGLQLLRPADNIDSAFEGKFVNGMYNDNLQDPPGAQWRMGGSAETVPHILIVVAADKQSDIDAEMTRLTNSIGESGGSGVPAMRLSGPPQAGATLPTPLRGHEHFGFKDGVSQPAIRGLASSIPTDFFESRLLDPADKNYDRFAEPGQVLVWPGQFLIGYKRQHPKSTVEARNPVPLILPWRKNGSYLVYRRLQQLVHKFWAFCETGAQALSTEDRPVTKELFAALLVGRWPSGAPLSRAPLDDNQDLAKDDLRNNNFRFSNPTLEVRLKNGGVAPSLPPAVPDPNGRVCPFVGHIRKVNPRDDATDTGGANDTLTRLMLRRGIPYGTPKDRGRLLEDDGVDRGLLFMSYQGSITDQFQFVTQTWVNKENAPHDSVPTTGHDPLIGQSTTQRFVRLPVDPDAGNDHEFVLPQEPWVLMTGGGYFFTPSISALSGALSEASPGTTGQTAKATLTVGPQLPVAARPKRQRKTGKSSTVSQIAAKKSAVRKAPRHKRANPGENER